MFNLFTCLSANPCRRSSVNMKRETQLPTGLRAPLSLPTTGHSSSHNFRLFHCARSFRKQLSLEALGNLSPSYTVWCWFILVLCHLHLLGPIQCHLGGGWHLATPPQHVRNRTKSPSQKGDPTETLCGTNLVSKKQKKRGAVENSKIYQKSCNITTSAAVLLVPAEAFAELHLLLNLSTARRAIKIKNTIVNLHCLGDILWAAEFGSVLDAIDTKSKLDAIRVSLGALWSLSNLQDFAMRIDAIRFVACIGFLPLNVLTAPASIWPWDRIRGEEPRGTDLMGQGHYRWLA